MPSHELRIDEIGYWSEVKLDIVKKYAQAYSKILAKKKKFNVTAIFVNGKGKNGKLLLQSNAPIFKGSKQDIKPYMKKGSKWLDGAFFIESKIPYHSLLSTLGFIDDYFFFPIGQFPSGVEY